MEIICSHVNTDFDALASMFAAKKLYPQAKVVITDKQNDAVKQFLAIYRDTLDLTLAHQIDWSQVTRLILVDVADLARLGEHAQQLDKEKVNITVFDHHPIQEGDLPAGDGLIEPVGATVTLLVEKIRKKNIPVSPFEATLFGLGLYTDTGSFTYSTTTSRDLSAASFLMEKGMNLEIIQRFSEHTLYDQQQKIFNHLFLNSREYKLEGLHIIISHYAQKKFQGGLASLTRKLLEITGADAVISIVEMQKRVYIIGRASSGRINFLPLISQWGGGGHQQAASATVKGAALNEIVEDVTKHLTKIIRPAITAQAIMSSPVKTIEPDLSIDEAHQLMFRYGHTGFPVVKDEKLVGIISRRDVDKAKHHGLGHAPVKAYMSSQVITVSPGTPLEEIQKVMITHDIGRIPVMDRDKLVGIISRTNIIEILHNQSLKENLQKAALEKETHNLSTEMEKALSQKTVSLLKEIGIIATRSNLSLYLIGGIVRDIILGRKNDDIDLVVEGDGIAFSQQLENELGGEVIIHEDFGTATWKHPSGLKLDIASSRLEYYEHPAALPNVERSTLKEDLYRRDFTINAMAICLNQDKFGLLIDPFQGRTHLQEKKIVVLHNLSFVEDPTRILRAVRFETRFRFAMDEQTEELALTCMDKIRALSTTRLYQELRKLFSEPFPEKSLKRLFQLQFWKQLGISRQAATPSSFHAKQLTMLTASLERAKVLDKKLNWFLYLLIPFYQDDQLERAQSLALTKQESKLLKEILALKNVEQWPQNNLGEMHRLAHQYAAHALLFHASLCTEEFQQLLVNYLRKRKELTSLLTGEDLKKQGLKPGPEFRQILFELEVAMLNDEVTTRKEALSWLKRYINEKSG